MGYMKQYSVSGESASLLSKPLLMMACGNSVIDSYGSWDESSLAFFPTAITEWARFYSGTRLKIKRLSGAATYYDRFGNVGHGGATLNTITEDISTSGWLTQLATDGLYPDIIMGVALLENNLMQGQTAEQCTVQLDSWLATVRGLFPGVIIGLGSPLPSFGYDTAAKQSAAFAVRDYMSVVAKTSQDIIYCDQGAGYRTAVYQPLALSWVEESAAPGTGTVHPQPKAAQQCGREWGAVLSAKWSQTTVGRLSGTNPAMIGSTDSSVSGSGVVGTMPTSCAFSLGTPTNYVTTSQALQPGWRVTFTQNAFSSVQHVSGNWCGNIGLTPLNAGFCEPYVQFKVNSGGAKLVGWTIAVRLFYTDSTNEFAYGTRVRSSDVDYGHGCSFQDGERISYRAPQINAAAGKTIQSISLYLLPTFADTIGACVLTIEIMGLLA